MIDSATFSNAVVAFVANYLVHSTLLLAACWLILTVTRTRSHFLTERLWKLSAVLGIVTAFTQVALGPAPFLRSLLSSGEAVPIVDAIETTASSEADAFVEVHFAENETAPELTEEVGNRAIVMAEVARTLPDDGLQPTSTSELRFTTDRVESLSGGEDTLEAATDLPTGLSTVNTRLEALSETSPRPAGRVAAHRPNAKDRAWLPVLLRAIAIMLVGGFIVGLALLAVQTLRLRCRFGSARVLERGPARSVLDRFLSRHKIRGRIRLLASSSHCEPIAYGLFQWTIVLPEGAEDRLERSELKALLAHEVAHLVRGDVRWLWAGRVLCTCFVFQPLNYLARRNWQQAAEYLCDDWAIDRGIRSLSLARCLTQVAEWRFGVAATEVGLAAGGSKATLVERVKRLVEEDPARDSWQRPARRKLLTLGVASAVVMLVGFAPRVALPLTPASELKAEGRIDSIESSPDQPTPSDWHALNEELLQLEADLQRLNQLRDGKQPAEAAGHFRHIEKRAATLRTRRENITSLLERKPQR